MDHQDAADTRTGVVACIQQIPPELLREIFLQASGCHADSGVFINASDVPQPIIISGVCSRWRAITHSFPRLWSEFIVDITSMERGHPQLYASRRRSVKRILDIFLTHSQETPLDISIIAPLDNDCLEYVSSFDLIECVFRESKRWKTASLSFGDTLTRPCHENTERFITLELSSTLSELESITLPYVPDLFPSVLALGPLEAIGPPADCLLNAPKLKTVTLGDEISPCYKVPSFHYPSSQLHRLVIHIASIDTTFLPMIQSCTSLDELDLHIYHSGAFNGRGAPNADDPSGLEMITLPHSTTIHCNYLGLAFFTTRCSAPMGYLKAFFDSVAFCGVKQLDIRFNHYVRGDEEGPTEYPFPHQSFIRSFSTDDTLHNLRTFLVNVPLDPERIVTILQHTASLETLLIKSSEFGAKSTIGNPLLRALRVPLRDELETKQTFLVPSLNSFYLSTRERRSPFDNSCLIDSILSRIHAVNDNPCNLHYGGMHHASYTLDIINFDQRFQD
jgi:hypothetical protein